MRRPHRHKDNATLSFELSGLKIDWLGWLELQPVQGQKQAIEIK
tara:strand:- start:55 stop:186 length:132 start_codon:yes stop_codon:yes gene_type:complete